MFTAICCLVLSLMPFAAQTGDPVAKVLDAVRQSMDASIEGWEFRVETGAREGEVEQRPWTPIRLSHSTTEYRYSYRAPASSRARRSPAAPPTCC
jgi:hypothetical protein